MLKTLQRLIDDAERARMRDYETNYRIRDLESSVEPVFDYVRLMFEATESDYQDRLELIGTDDIKKYTLSEVECARFMTDRQFNNLRASKKGDDNERNDA
jgi:hypothetical protein